ncbi:hypothetical protein EUGRSUZ_A00220 [Eucalyptus grandis]|uniref:Uncharacterized protein n=2 Tax=Eucalyptus grandis TaxID=71139 RepID=A0A059DBH1_EUCGR|nr:hypothetical protein EUGRSUZ_A00220 [Eucalyptus grandis]
MRHACWHHRHVLFRAMGDPLTDMPLKITGMLPKVISMLFTMRGKLPKVMSMLFTMRGMLLMFRGALFTMRGMLLMFRGALSTTVLISGLMWVQWQSITRFEAWTILMPEVHHQALSN